MAAEEGVAAEVVVAVAVADAVEDAAGEGLVPKGLAQRHRRHGLQQSYQPFEAELQLCGEDPSLCEQARTIQSQHPRA